MGACHFISGTSERSRLIEQIAAAAFVASFRGGFSCEQLGAVAQDASASGEVAIVSSHAR
jgi:hypothetical protein